MILWQLGLSAGRLYIYMYIYICMYICIIFIRNVNGRYIQEWNSVHLQDGQDKRDLFESTVETCKISKNISLSFLSLYSAKRLRRDLVNFLFHFFLPRPFYSFVSFIFCSVLFSQAFVQFFFSCFVLFRYVILDSRGHIYTNVRSIIPRGWSCILERSAFPLCEDLSNRTAPSGVMRDVNTLPFMRKKRSITAVLNDVRRRCNRR